ncbi:uncharacterized protein N7482_000870 [Penicillium canariense]|uniref:Mucin-7 n=1 Tax=Penicillium canariense TaxID=189055 RepID=A0A9W9LSE0_9EURO|nr:uncharacterized protein N7482_000870 [Penicillium canariense]KAJ5174993.1 hypothetical protein N7482_000870 [Penicillium canariense]
MSDNAHPGVRSLLAKFENSQSPITSPPSRGRSPVGSDTPGSTRQLSKVRASFVTVEGAIQSNPGSPLRKSSGRSDSPGIFGPKLNAEEVETRRQNNVVSPTPGGHVKSYPSILDGAADDIRSEMAATVTKERKVSGNEEPSAPTESAAPPKEATLVKTEAPAPSVPAASSNGASAENLAPKAVTRRPSNIHSAKNNASSKPASSKPASSAPTATTPRSTNSAGAKPTSAREVAKERANALAHKPSRASLNPAFKPSTRATRGSTPSTDTHKPSPSSATDNKTQSKSPTRSVRLPASITAQTQSSTAKYGSAGPVTGRTEKPTATLTRKPSTLKSVAAPAGGVRRQVSRPSLPTQPAPERPSSRVSDSSSKPVNEGFLARMMRPTASSASKTHEKGETKAPPKPPVSKAPRPSMGRASERSATQAKSKPAPLKAQSEKSQPANKEVQSPKEEVKAPQKKPESEKENMEEVASVTPEEPNVPQAEDTIIEESEPEVPTKAIADDTAEKPTEPTIQEATVESTLQPVAKSTEPSVEPTATEVTVGLSAEPVAEDVPEAPADPVAEAKDESPKEEPEVPAVKDAEEVPAEATAEASGEKVSSEPQAEAEAPREDTAEALVAPTEPIITEDTAITEMKETPKVVPEVLEAPQQTDTAAPASHDDVPEVVMDITSAQPSEKTNEEPRESSPAAQPAAQAKSHTIDIDFAHLALS